MAKKSSLPLVAICGRPNVGKSTLFNRIIAKQRAIVHAEEGITRDRAYGSAEWGGRRFRVVDTGGIVENPIDPIVEKMQEQIRAALDEADVIVFLVDGQQEITRIDAELRDELFTYGKPVVLAVNKLDNPDLELNRHEFYALGIGEPHAISSGHGLGIGALLDAVVALLPEPTRAPELEAEGPSVTRVAVIGKPNVGKSSFVNAILNEERQIVTEVPGTTRDAVDLEFRWRGKDYILIDTAGMRKKAGIKRKVEYYSVARALRAVRRADVCLVMVDAVEGVTDQDKRILGYVQEQGAAIVIVLTKWDRVADKDGRFKELSEELTFRAPFVKYVPFITISNVTRQRLYRTFEVIDRVAAEAAKRISTAELNRLLEEIRNKEAPAVYKGKQAKIRYATQAGVKPTRFVLFVNQKRLFHFSYVRHIENRLRQRYGFEGVPIQLELREGRAPAAKP
ncbi:MAG TPA: ribosome biogenesis GTPase Der [Candidatus Hydrogenedentes bacterium]|nr:ribosome biogenesis GTPase Der [Candidatus Hydrogenedentota bacterium]